MINTEIYFNNLTELETRYKDLYPFFNTHDDWVDFINEMM